ncbi:MAG: hypothetical protein ACRD1O_11110 [Terriglobia bacterium]
MRYPQGTSSRRLAGLGHGRQSRLAPQIVVLGPLFDPFAMLRAGSAACPWPRKKPQRYNTNAVLHVLAEKVGTVNSSCELSVGLL